MKKLLLCTLVIAMMTPIAAVPANLALKQEQDPATTQKPVSVRRAVLYSALIPGAGEAYAHSYNKAAFFITVEAAILFTYWRLDQERQWKIDSYEDYAYTFADVPRGSSDDVYRRLQNYYSSDVYNRGVMQDARNYYLIYQNDPESYQTYIDANIYTGNDTWQWATEANWREYQKLRGDKQDLEIYAKFALGGLLINRIISIIDAARSARSYNESLFNGEFSVVPDLQNKGFFVNYEYRF